uniref:Uncharacterized protein n=1 Tax=Salix viminalis TaxID=40686 RepID=A0A6N2JYX4_SALVM
MNFLMDHMLFLSLKRCGSYWLERFNAIVIPVSTDRFFCWFLDDPEHFEESEGGGFIFK